MELPKKIEIIEENYTAYIPEKIIRKIESLKHE